jgi:hypothetical protein
MELRRGSPRLMPDDRRKVRRCMMLRIKVE